MKQFEQLNKQCTCGVWLTTCNAKYLGIMGGQADVGWDLELWECRSCGSSQARKINERHFTDEQIQVLEMDLQKKGFFQEAANIANHLKEARDENRSK